MAASVLHLLGSLETHLERTKAELESLREENAQLKRQLATQQVQVPATPIRPTQAETEPEEVTSSSPEEQPEESALAGVVKQESMQNQQNQPPSPHALLKQWYQRYPQAFYKGHTKPLKVGIHQDLAEREPWSNKLIRRALANYVNLPRYVKSMREGAERVDLDGQPAGKVDKEAALHANARRKEQPSDVTTKQGSSPSSKAHASVGANTEGPVAKPHEQAVKPGNLEKSQQKKPLSLEDKLKGLQQKFKVR